MDGHLVTSTYYQLLIMLLWIWVYKYLLEPLLSILLGIYLKWNHMVDLIFWGTVILFSIVAAPFTFLLTVHKGSNIFKFSPMFVIFWVFDSRHPNGWYLSEALICFSDVEHLLVCLFNICMSSWRKISPSPVLIFSWAIWVGCCCCCC